MATLHYFEIIIIISMTVIAPNDSKSEINNDTDKISMDTYRLKDEVNLNTGYSCEQVWLQSCQNFIHKIASLAGYVYCIGGNQSGMIACNCVNHDDDHDSNCLIVGRCPYTCGFYDQKSHWTEKIVFPLPKDVNKLNQFACGRLNRTGRLCSECMEGLSPQVYSYDLNCIRCDNNNFNWFKFIAVAFIPLTVFYFIVILFRINATNPYMYGFITFNQFVGSPIFLRACFLTLKGKYKFAVRLIALPYGVWNLDFFRSLPLDICLNLTTLQTLALDYAIAVYPLLLVVITYILIELHARGCRLLLCLWRPFHRCCVWFTRIMDIRSSIIKAFATFLLLSYVKLLNSTLDMLSPTKVHDINSNFTKQNWYVYYDASYKYFGKEHLSYAIMTILFFFVFVLSPLVFLLVYPTRCFQKYCCGSRNQLLRTFADTFQGHYKDGTQPQTRDCRWFAAVYFLGRIVLLYFIFGVTQNRVCFVLAGLFLILLGIVMVLFQPYKSAKANTFHTVLPFFMAFSSLLITLLNESEVMSRPLIKHIVPVAIFCFTLPIVIVISYTVYTYVLLRVYKKCRELHLKRVLQRENSEQQSLL